ncbi:response regulator [Rhodoferax sp. PAMC 29310]|uniref:response regulator n=1 Tax=Rhodoferax sp. PAMC 29310 TaxID=2822760 RepID=UPI001B34476D|nr:response regulator [Rhodoferax sp. PAMC 29310]
MKTQIGIGEASKKMGLSRTSIQKLVDSGQLIAVKTVGGHRRILQSSLDQLDEKMGPKAMQRLAASDMNAGNLEQGSRPSHANVSELAVLIAEDDAVVSTSITASLSKLYPSIKFVVTEDGLDAVLNLERNRPHILITDLKMTPFDGFSLIQRVANRAEYQSISIVVISSMSEEEIEQRGGLPDNVLFYPKPLNMERLKGFFDAHMQLLKQQFLPA